MRSMRFTECLFVTTLLCATTLHAQTWTRWQTTRNGRSSGECRLETNRIRATLRKFHVDVVEEAVIRATGSVSWGDPNTLEITGKFTLAPGTTVRSMLLWNGNEILKAKLKDRDAADSAYESVVNRVQVRDPAIIELVGPNTYEFKIYPVAINQTRKIRILYSVPLKGYTDGPRFRIQTAFTIGPREIPTQIPFEFMRGDAIDDCRYMLKHGNTRRPLQFGVTYMLPTSDFYEQARYYYARTPRYLEIAPDTSSWHRAYTFTVDSGKAAGNYAAIFTTVPDTLRGLLETGWYGDVTLETRIATSEKAYISTLTGTGCMAVYLKSAGQWDRNVYWSLYDSEGSIICELTQSLAPDTTSPSLDQLPLVWAGKYCLEEGKGSLGALFGFVDTRMSLLALESDRLNPEEAALWRENGVPPLEPDEIVISPWLIEPPPAEDVIFEMPTDVLTNGADAARVMQVELLAGGRLMLQFDGATTAVVARVILLDLRGRVVGAWNNVALVSGRTELALPAGLHGTYLVRAVAGTRRLEQRLVIR